MKKLTMRSVRKRIRLALEAHAVAVELDAGAGAYLLQRTGLELGGLQWGMMGKCVQAGLC
jgi:uncharacterized membrane protein